MTNAPNDPPDDELVDPTTAMLVIDFDLRSRAASAPAAALLGYTRAELLAMTVDRIVAFGADWLRDEVEALRTYGTWQGDVAYRHQDGHLIPCTVSVKVVATPDGNRLVTTIERR